MPPDTSDANFTSRPSVITRLNNPSRTASRSRTTSRASSPSRLSLPPTLRPAVSFQSISQKGLPSSPSHMKLTASAVPPHLSIPTVTSSTASVTGIESSASSTANFEIGDGILVKDLDSAVDAEVRGSEASSVVGYIEEPAADGEVRRNLREQLRKTLNQESTSRLSSKQKGKGRMSFDEQGSPVSNISTKPRHYFVLTDAGKPVFASSSLAEDSDTLASTMGLMQALISVFIDDGDKLRYINAGRMRISFVLRSPLYFACVSDWGEPESVMRSHLEYLHLQILSVVSGAQLKRIFEKRTNFDLRRLLSGTETLLHSILTRLQTDLAMSTSSLICLPLDNSLRKRAGEALVPQTKMKDILYIMLVARGRVITLVRPKKHSVHPADLHVLLNTIHAPAIFESPAAWLPICLPKFNPSGFLHVYVNFLRHGDLVEEEEGVGNEESVTNQQTSHPRATSSEQSETRDSVGNATEESESTILTPSPGQTTDTSNLKGRIGLGLVCISGGGGGEFETVREWCETITKNLETSGTTDAIENVIRKGLTDYSASSLGIPGLRHFVYKSRPHVQVTYPLWEGEYANEDSRRRLITLYQSLHDAIHGKSGQKETLKLQYIRTEHESVMGWITQPFELYIATSSHLPKSAIVNAANAVSKWVKKEESRLFLRDAPVF